MQRAAARALRLHGGVASISQVMKWAYALKLRRGGRLARNDYHSARRALARIAVRIGRAVRLTSGTRTSSTRCATPSWRRISLRTFGGDETLRAPVGARNEWLGSRTAHGNGTAFSAVAPSERPCLPSIDPIFGSGILPGPNTYPTFTRLFGSAFCRSESIA